MFFALNIALLLFLWAWTLFFSAWSWFLQVLSPVLCNKGKWVPRGDAIFGPPGCLFIQCGAHVCLSGQTCLAGSEGAALFPFVLPPPRSNMKSPSQSLSSSFTQMPHSALPSPSNFVHVPCCISWPIHTLALLNPVTSWVFPSFLQLSSLCCLTKSQVFWEILLFSSLVSLEHRMTWVLR